MHATQPATQPATQIANSNPGANTVDGRARTAAVSNLRLLSDGGEIALSAVFAMLNLDWQGDPKCAQQKLPRKRVRAGQCLISDTCTANALYVIRTGAFKVVALDAEGMQQVIGFPMMGHIIGLEAFGDGHYRASAYALEDSEVVVLSLTRLGALGKQYHGIEQLMYRCMAQALVREQDHLWALGSQSAQARVAQFLLNTAKRNGAAGYSSKTFVLRMSRLELASFLGLTIETVSRTLSAMQKLALIQVAGRQIDLCDITQLHKLCRSGERVPLRTMTQEHKAFASAQVAQRAVAPARVVSVALSRVA